MRGDDMQTPGASGACGHDEALLKNAALSLETAQAEAQQGQEASSTASDAEWSGTAAESYRARTAYIAAELAAITAGLVALGVLLTALQREAQDCGVASPAVPTAAQSGAPHLPFTAARGPLVPQPSAGPLLPYESRPPLLPHLPTSEDACR
jgi:hypothetical protein